MKTIKKIEQLKKVHKLIKRESTGSPKELASRVNVSERQIFIILEQLREMEAPIRFNRRTNTYFYDDDFELLINISVQVMQREKLLSIYAGKNLCDTVQRLQGSCSDRSYLRFIKTRLDVVG